MAEKEEYEDRYSICTKRVEDIMAVTDPCDISDFISEYKREVKMLIAFKRMRKNKENIDDWECLLGDALFGKVKPKRYLD